ncbi:unnamed protein product [Lactuca saligna]|uniref:Uncharacterized protein n=1 Tax=Lactuca saligna TaxID=75948 RepID=A0AA35YBC1_LACSI|nr:unnamed protein product [Lactuca saligna]
MVSSSNTHTQGYKEWALTNRWSEDLRCECDEPATFSISKNVDNPWRKFRGCPNYQFHMDLEEGNNNKAFGMEVLKLSEEAKNNKAVQLDILNLLKVELLMMVMLLVVVIVMGFMVYNVMVKAM